jgi:hypothetical protein
MSELGDRRKLFTRCLHKLLGVMLEAGDDPMIGKDGLRHKPNSLHFDGLAMDIDLIRKGEYLSKTSDHEVYGRYWETLDPLCVWGGHFDDGNHYAVTMGGRK